MDALELFMLGRKLMKLADRALPDSDVPTSVRSVLIDVTAHPRTSISQITARTGFLQSQVSSSVARLRDLGAVETEPDPADGRSTLVRVVPSVVKRAAKRSAVPVDAVLAVVMADRDPSEVREVIDALEMLSKRLTPKARARIAAERAS
jgi:DNA-binding MarR family transcriptional regulator